MDIKEKAEFIDRILGFYFKEPFLSGIASLPCLETEVDTWFKFATVFHRVFEAASVRDDQKEALQLLVEDATTEFESAAFLGESPDQEEELGVGYDSYEIPEGFAKRLQQLIWREVIHVYGGR